MSATRTGHAMRRYLPGAMALLRAGALLAGTALILTLSGLGRIG
ncbi:hypothetical protein [Falsiroseomonas oryziterrae]|nr:hypothetical protein [Roseomonas sp. NPKOSM-4]